MASFVGAIEKFNPYVQQIPVDAYTKVGTFKQQQYDAGVMKVQDTIDNIAGLDIANEGGRAYLQNRVADLTKNLNKYSQVDLSNPNNVSQLIGLAKPLYQDTNIVNDVVNTGIYRKWSKEANESFRAGRMELGQYARESNDANKWLSSTVAGSQYTGRQTPNTVIKKDLVDRIVKAKKDAFDKNEYVYDQNYSKDTPYYVKSTNKYYSEADFNNFVTDSILDDKSREMLMNEHWYENMGVPPAVLQQQDVMMYQSKIDANNKRIKDIQNDPLLYAGDKKAESQQVIDNLTSYNEQLSKGKLSYLKSLNLDDPASADVFHRDLSESRFVNSLAILRDETRKQELQKNDQWFEELKLEAEAAKAAAKGTGKAGAGKKTTDEVLTDEVSAFTPVLPGAPRTELSLNVIQQGWQIKNDQINNAMNSLIGKLQQNGVDINQYVDGWDQTQVGTKAGASMAVPRFKNPAAKEQFYNMVAGLNFAYTKEAQDGHLDNKDFGNFIKTVMIGYKDDDPNSKFTLADKAVSDGLNSLKGTTALLPRLDKLFADKEITNTFAQIDEAIKSKKDMANSYREAMLKSNALTTEERNSVLKLSDDDLLGQNFILDKDQEARRYGIKNKVEYSVEKNGDSYDVYQNIYDNSQNGTITRGLQNLAPEYGTGDINLGPLKEKRKLSGGFSTEQEAQSALSSGVLNHIKGVSRDSFKKAEDFVKQTYSYVQEDLNTTVVNLKGDKDAYLAVTDGLTLFATKAKGVASSDDFQVDGVPNPSKLQGISKMNVLGASVSNTEDIFNPNPIYNVQFEATTIDDKGKPVTSTYDGKISLKSFLATNPNYRTSEYAKYFAPMVYAEKDAYARIKATVNPLEGSHASYSNRNDIEPVFNRQGQQGQPEFIYDDPKGDKQYGNDYQWETIPVNKDNKQTMVSYQVVSLGQNTNLGNLKNKDGNQYAPGAFYIKIKVPTSTGKPSVIFLKSPDGKSVPFNSASAAHYTMRDLILNNQDIRMDDIDVSTGQPDYFTANPNTIRGIMNSQLSYNGFSKLEPTKIKDAVGKEIQKLQAKGVIANP